MQNAYSINQSETLPLNYVNKPLVNNLSDRGTGQRACIRYYYERYIIFYVNIEVIEQSKATLTLYNVTTPQPLYNTIVGSNSISVLAIQSVL